LWNKAPYSTFFQEKDKFNGSVKPQWAAPVNVTAAGAEFKKEFTGDLPTGAVRYYPLTFDSSVRSLAFLNGLSYNLRKDSVDNSQWGSELTDAADQTYASDPLPDAEQAGILAFVMYKRAGQTIWEMMPFGATDAFSYCVDTMGKIESAVVVISNQDWDNPDRVVSSPGIDSIVYATNLPCAGYQGTSTITNYNHGVSDIYTVSNLSFKSGSTAQYSLSTFPYISFELQGASVSWRKSGTDSVGCTYSGSDSFSIGPHPGAGSETIVLYAGLLSGSPSYRGYQGGATPDSGTQSTYQMTCPNETGGTTTTTETEYHETHVFWVPITDDRANVKIGANGVLQGSYRQVSLYNEEDWTQYEWNLSPLP
jgi:hypothetical protein